MSFVLCLVGVWVVMISCIRYFFIVLVMYRLRIFWCVVKMVFWVIWCFGWVLLFSVLLCVCWRMWCFIEVFG